MSKFAITILLVLTGITVSQAHAAEVNHAVSTDTPRQVRARDIGIAPGILRPGPLNSITDVDGVLVGHFTLVKDKNVRTGATAILPHRGNLYQDRVPAGIHVANGHGKFAGTTQIVELGEIETPIVLTNTLAVARGIEAIIDWTLSRPGNELVRSVNAVVGETNDSRLNDIRYRALTTENVLKAITTASGGLVEEGAIGAGAGTVAFGWKGGIGTSSRRLPSALGGYTVGVLVQTNFGGILTVDGVRIGQKLGQHYLREELDNGNADGSIVMVVATDAPLSDRNLRRLARRAPVGLARTGASFTNGSGDYSLAFSTAPSVRRTAERRASVSSYAEVSNDNISPLFQAVAEATEEAIYNSLFMSESVTGFNSQTQSDELVEKFPINELNKK